MRVTGSIEDAEHDDIAAGLVRNEHVSPGRFDGEVARRLDACSLVANCRQLACHRIDRENRDRVVRVAVRYIDELPRRVHDCFCRTTALALDIAGQGGQHLLLGQGAFSRVVVTGDDGQVGLAIDVGALAVRAPCEVARSGALRSVERSMRGQRSFRSVEGIDDDLAQTQVAAQRELVGLVDVDRVAVLAFADVLLERGSVAEHAGVRVDRDRDATATRVVGGENVSAGRIDDQVARRGALRGLRVEKRQLTGLRIDGECAEGRLPFVDGVEELLVWMKCDKGGVGRLDRQRRSSE